MLTFALVTTLIGATVVQPVTKDDQKKTVRPPAHQVAVIYFHRTVRCPTCKRIGGLAEGAVAKGFSKEVKSRTVTFRLVDFQDKENAKLAKHYKIAGPTLVLTNDFDGKAVRWKGLSKVWQLVGQPAEFRDYVQLEVTTYLKQTKEEAIAKNLEESKE